MILYRYIIREFIKPFTYALSTIMMLFVMQLVVRLLPKVLYKGVPPSVIVELFAVNLASIAVLSVPMALLISMLMVFGKLTSDNELAAIKAGGHSIMSLLPPVVAVSGLIATIMLFFNTAVLPEANHHGSTLFSDIMRKKPAAMIEPGVLIKDFPGYALMVDSVNHEKGELFGIKIFSEENGNKPTVTVAEHGTIFMTADQAHVQLTLHNGETHRQANTKEKEHYKIYFETQIVHFANVDSDLKKSENRNRGDREKTNDQLLKEVEGFKKVRTDLRSQHEKSIDELLALTDTLWTVHDSIQHVEDSLQQIQDSIVTDSIELAKELDSQDRDTSDTVLLAAVLADTPVIEDTSVVDSNKTDSMKENSSAIDSTTGPPEAKAEMVVLATLNEIEEKSNGRKYRRIIRNSLTHARLKDQRTDKQNKKINSHLVEVHKKYALAVSVVIFALLGVPLGIISKSSSVAISVSYSMLFFIMYYAFLMAGEKISESQGLSPAIAMWMGNATLGVIAIWLIYLTVKESPVVTSGLFKHLGLIISKWATFFKRIFTRKKQSDVATEADENNESRKKLNPFRVLWVGIKRIIFFPAYIIKFLMPKLPGYILGRFFSFFFTVTIGLTILTVVIDYISTINRLEGSLPKELLEYYLYFMAWFFSILLPMALLIATMMTIGSFAKTNELTAIKAAGISIVKMTIPLLIVGLFFSVFSFYFSEQILPEANRKRDHLKEVFAARRNNRPIPTAKKSYKHDFYYFSNSNTAYRFTHFQTSPARGDKVTRYRFGDGTLLETTEIRKMVYEDSLWYMISGIKREFTQDGYTSERFGKEQDENITDSPEEMVKTVGSAEQKSYGEMTKIMEKARQRGEDVSRYQADLNFKFALPLMNFIVILIGVSVTARSDKRGGAVHFGAGMGLVALYWAVSQTMLVFGRGGQLDPMFAAWSGTVIFLVVGLLLYRKASR